MLLSEEPEAQASFSRLWNLLLTKPKMDVQGLKNRGFEHKALRKELDSYANTWPNLVMKPPFSYFLIFKSSYFDLNLLSSG